MPIQKRQKRGQQKFFAKYDFDLEQLALGQTQKASTN
jgi:hypothetical protein